MPKSKKFAPIYIFQKIALQKQAEMQEQILLLLEAGLHIHILFRNKSLQYLEFLCHPILLATEDKFSLD